MFVCFVSRYLDHFPQPKNLSGEYLFEKSAAYFDNAVVPQRVHALLPSVKVIAILYSPSKRAYSWYQVTCLDLGFCECHSM